MSELNEQIKTLLSEKVTLYAEVKSTEKKTKRCKNKNIFAEAMP